MPRIIDDPTQMVCPNFEGPEWEFIRHCVFAHHGNIPFMAEEAARQLRELWTRGYDASVAAWKAQLEHDRAEQDNRGRQAYELNEARHAQLETEAAEQRREAEKKKPRLNPFDPTRRVSDWIVPRPASYALAKINNLEYVELDYFTDLRPSKNIRNDEDLSWEEMLEAKNTMLHFMAQSGLWPTAHSESLKAFFVALEQHPRRLRVNGKKVLLVYQSRVRREWFDALARDGGFNIGLIEDDLVRNIADEVNDRVWESEMDQVSANLWVAVSTCRGGSSLGSESPIVVERKVKALLNELIIERFDSISDEIIAWANKSEKEKDGRTLFQVIKLVFEKATDGEMFSEICARLCRKMMEQISPKVQDDGVKNSEGKPFAGGSLFRKYLLDRCQEDFERGWVAKEATAFAAATKASADKAVREANDKTKGGEESELYLEEYYAAAKEKRRGLGLIRFIGELFKLQMLTERIMHECIRKFLGNVENPSEEEIESLCRLLITVGSLLDKPKYRAHLDVYFSRMRELTKNKNVNARMVFMLQGVIELRGRKWIPRNAVAAPTTIAQVHEAAAKEKLAQEKSLPAAEY